MTPPIARGMENLVLGNPKRFRRAEFKRQLIDGTTSLSDALRRYPIDERLINTSSMSNTLTITDVLTWEPGLARARAERLLRRAGIPGHLPVDALSQARRDLIADRLDERKR